MIRRTLLLVAFTAACVRHQPQAVAPMRVDSAHVVLPPTSGDSAGAPAELFTRVEHWPGPNQFRSASGAPGAAYWQQRADYTIAITLDTAARSVSGSVTIRYTNNSPDTLRFVWLQLDQNLYRAGSMGSLLYPAESRWGVRGFEGGFDIAALTVDGRAAVGEVNDTRMRIDLASPIAPRGGTATISMRFAFRVPEHGSDRMGREGMLYEIAQWYPRMAVFDDVRGWNTDPYLGQGEFYLEYGDVDYTVTVPAGYVVAGSGVLQNANEVLTREQRERFERAARSTSVVAVITRDEADAARRRPVEGTRSWRFRAERVRDVAWAAAPDFRWDATSWNGVVTQAFYQFPRAGRAWESAADQTRWSIRTYSQLVYPYPYPQATSVAGPVGGMEYPMFVMVHYGDDDPSSIFGTLDHEHGHEWFPMLVGSNERRFAWQDEGINTYINAFSSERRYPGSSVFPDYVADWRQAVSSGTQSPLMTPPDLIDPGALGAIGYRKPATVLLALRNGVVGREAMDRAMREYTRRWAFRHPTPADFFRTVENVTGEDLSWFWRAFFYGTDVLDIAIEGVATIEQGGQRIGQISLRRNTSVPFPIQMRLKLADGSTQDVSLPVLIWNAGATYRASVPVDAPITGAWLWPDRSVPDVVASNDHWGEAPREGKPAPVTSGGLASPIGEAKP